MTTKILKCATCLFKPTPQWIDLKAGMGKLSCPRYKSGKVPEYVRKSEKSCARYREKK